MDRWRRDLLSKCYQDKNKTIKPFSHAVKHKSQILIAWVGLTQGGHAKGKTKAEFAEEGTFFVNRFPSLRTFVNKKVGVSKTKPA